MGVNDDDHQEQQLESFDSLSLTDFPLSKDRDSDNQHHDNNIQSPPSPGAEDIFEFCSGGHKMSHAEDIIFDGKLIPINKKHISNNPRSESMRELKSTTNKGTTASQLVRNSYSFDQRKLNKNAEMNRNSLSTKSSSSRWSDHLVFAPIKVPEKMDLKDIRNRQIVQNMTSKPLFRTVEGGSDGFVEGDHRKTSWRVLGFLSCRRSGSVAVTMPLS